MLFVTLLSPKATATPAETIPRRVQWKYPEGLKVIAEYWLQTDKPHVIIVAEANEVAPMMMATEAWGDLFDFTVVPAITAEDGLKLISQMMPPGA